jgi:hypothetical protein
MESINTKRTKTIARVLLLIWIANIILPTSVYALTSGPSQPEAQNFQAAGVSDMVDLSTGDFKYNIPLMDVDGYPLNLSYQSGIGIDDEASWVGLGWNLNVGSITRQVRGVPDDFSNEEFKTTHYTKPKITVGGKISAKVEVRGKARLGGTFTFGVFSDNYTGVGAEIGVNAGISFGKPNSGLLTGSMGINILSNTSSGVDATPYMSLSIMDNSREKNAGMAGLSASLGYNSRSGMKALTLGASYSIFNNSVSFAFNTEPISPRIQIPYKTSFGSVSFDVGFAAPFVFTAVGGSGYRNIRELVTSNLVHRQYGFLYAENAKSDPNAVMDFIREKENPIINELPNLALPVHTPDMFSYTSQNGSGQFRLYRGGTGVFADNEVSEGGTTSTTGFDIGIGFYAHGGVSKYDQSSSGATRKWRSDNAYLKNGDFQHSNPTDPSRENVYFKNVNDKTVEDGALSTDLKGTSAVAVRLSNQTALSSFRDNSNYYASNLAVSTPIEKKSRQPKTTAISYLTAKEASHGALDKRIYWYNSLNATNVATGLTLPVKQDSLERTTYPAHHLSELTVTGTGGERMVYGIPVYNTLQEEYSFAVGNKGKGQYKMDGNLVKLEGADIQYLGKGVDHYFHKETLAKHATSYLLTALVSADYQDMTGNGISNDDIGTALKFNYSKVADFGWRTPYAKDASTKTATLNKGLLADPDDDKGSIVYGRKDLFYIQTIESKTQIAYFITADRLDALGVTDHMGTIQTDKKQKCLKQIRLYSKGNLKVPIKVVNFDYGYDLCHHTPNSTGGAKHGKLTLKKVWFEYGGTSKGKYQPYKFTYNVLASDATSSIDSVKYKTLATDRWGVYKPKSLYQGQMGNDEFPYSNQTNLTAAATDAGLFHLNKIDLPTGGTINITYEADDYAYVQNKRASIMVPIQSFNGPDPGHALKNATGFTIPLGAPLPTGVGAADLGWFKKNYLNGSEYIYTKTMVKVSTPSSRSWNCDYDFVSSYCRVIGVNMTGSDALLTLETINEGGVTQNPILFAARQKMKNEYPRYAYPGFDNRVGDNASSGITAAVSAISNAVSNLSELKENFYEKAQRKDLATIVDMGKTFARIIKGDGHKVGGGLRVRKISIADNWKEFTDNNSTAGVYGQSYAYTKMENGKPISSGVASYEPSVGNDENSMKLAVPYVQRIKGAINNYFELEEPFGESFFPSPNVVYSKVTVKDLEANGAEVESPNTGSIVNEFYTAKDFPVKVTILPIQRNNPKKAYRYSLVETNSFEEMTLSQGYSVEVNDMHGKQKATRVFNQAGAEVSSSVYHYAVNNPNAETLTLNNAVNTIDNKGIVHTGRILGRDIELFTDFREQESKNIGRTINIGVDVIPAFFFPIPIPHWPLGDNNEYKMFRSACAVKVVQSTGLLKKVVRTENGSSIAVENAYYDELTGEPIVTKTQNEFDKEYYSVNLPAYWVYQGMGGAYQTLGTILKDLNSASGSITNSTYANFLSPGDAVVNVSTGGRYWVIETSGAKRLIDSLGTVKNVSIPLAKVVRSGHRNQLQASTSSIVCMANPVQNNSLKVIENSDWAKLKVINASVNTFDEKWAVNSVSLLSTNTNVNAIPSGTENTSFDFTFKAGTYVTNGAYLANYGEASTPLRNNFWGTWENPGGRLVEAGVYPNDFRGQAYNGDDGMGFYHCIYIPVSKNYYVGWGGNGRVSMVFDNSSQLGTLGGYPGWYLTPVYLSAGYHLVRFALEFGLTDVESGYGVGVEIYDNTYDELLHADDNGSGVKIIFSTGDFRGVATLNSYWSVRTPSNPFGVHTQHYAGFSASSVCGIPNTNLPIVNPYLTGYLGNWRPYQTKVYQEQRQYNEIFTAGQKGVNAKDAGFFKTFRPWWVMSGSSWQGSGQIAWTNANTVTLYDKYGQELENKDALGRYSAANFDFNGELPALVASNAMNREVFTNSFEDEKFKTTNGVNIASVQLKSNDSMSIANLSTQSTSHAGLYSLSLNTSGITLETRANYTEHKIGNYLSASTTGYRLMGGDIYPNGFQPIPAKKYIISTWVKDGQATVKNVNISANIRTNNGSLVNVPLTCKAIVEGWKLLEGSFTATVADKFEVILKSNSGTVNIDDIRIHPKDAHLKSYAYNEQNFKLMAELDENAFATFYEYDDEGQLIRVKKETERGIMTLKETRSVYRKNPNYNLP